MQTWGTILEPETPGRFRYLMGMEHWGLVGALRERAQDKTGVGDEAECIPLLRAWEGFRGLLTSLVKK